MAKACHQLKSSSVQRRSFTKLFVQIARVLELEFNVNFYDLAGIWIVEFVTGETEDEV
jgi:uncharacterized protein (DUF2164 family)